MKSDHKSFMQALLNGEEISVNGDKTRFKLDENSGNLIFTRSIMESFVGKPLNGLTVYENFEIVPKIISINGIDVQAPVRKPLEKDQQYWIADITEQEDDVSEYFWENDTHDFYWLKCGLIHLTEEAAETHKKALLSFTKV